MCLKEGIRVFIVEGIRRVAFFLDFEERRGFWEVGSLEGEELGRDACGKGGFGGVYDRVWDGEGSWGMVGWGYWFRVLNVT